MSDDQARQVISENLRRLRGERTLMEVGRSCQTSAGAIQQIERGKRMPGAGLLSRLAATFDVSLDELMRPTRKSKKTA